MTTAEPCNYNIMNSNNFKKIFFQLSWRPQIHLGCFGVSLILF